MKERFIELTKKAVDILSSGGIFEVVVDEAVIIGEGKLLKHAIKDLVQNKWLP